MEIYERLKYLRKEILNLTQEEFSQKLLITRGNLASIEVGRISLTDRNIQMICTIFNVNENWLRTGEGDPFNELSEHEELAAWMGSIMKPENDGGTKQRIIQILSQLDDDEWEVIGKIAERIAEEYKKD